MRVGLNGWPLFMTDRFLTEGQTDFLDEQILEGRFQKEILRDCQTKFVKDCFEQVLEQFGGNFGQFFGIFFAIFEQFFTI